MYKDEPFVLATQAKQVFYVDDHLNGPQRQIIEQCNHRHVWDIPDMDTIANEPDDVSNNVDGLHGQLSSNLELVVQLSDLEVVSFCHPDVSSEAITNENVLSTGKCNDDDFINNDDIDDTVDEYEEEDENEVAESDDEGMEVTVSKTDEDD